MWFCCSFLLYHFLLGLKKSGVTKLVTKSTWVQAPLCCISSWSSFLTTIKSNLASKFLCRVSASNSVIGFKIKQKTILLNRDTAVIHSIYVVVHLGILKQIDIFTKKLYSICLSLIWFSKYFSRLIFITFVSFIRIFFDKHRSHFATFFKSIVILITNCSVY